MNITKRFQDAYEKLKEYHGNNPYLLWLKNGVFYFKNIKLNSLAIDYINKNYDFEPQKINKIVKIADWFGERLKDKWSLDFVPEKLYITYYFGCTDEFYVFYCICRKSQEKAYMCVASKRAVLTDFLSEDINNKEIDFSKYEIISGRKLMKHQEEAVKFLVSREKAILSTSMGGGKTTSAIVSALEGGYEHILIICPASVKTTWKKELMMYVKEDDIAIVEGSKWEDKKFTIINFDILDNFYEIPTENVKKKDMHLDENGKIVVEQVEKQVVSRKKAVIDAAMLNSQLFQGHYDLIIIDEAHRLSNSSSNRYKIITDLIKRLKPRGIFELTGTMVTNSPINLYNLLKIIGCPVANNWQNYVKRYCDGKQIFVKKEKDVYTKIFLNKKGKSHFFDLTQSERDELYEFLEQKCRKIWLTSGASNLEELKEVIKPYYLRREKEEFGDMVKKEVKVLHYELTKDEKEEYSKLWDDYVSEKSEEKDVEDIEKYRQITEISVLRQWLAKKMLEKTKKLADNFIKEGHKIVIFAAFDSELNSLVDYFGDKCVFHNGKITAKKKDKAVDTFQTDDNVKVFVGNIESASVGITLTAADIVIFNSFSFVPAENLQAEDRIHRLNQTKPCTVYYQSFQGTYFDRMIELVRGKNEIINNIIVSEKEK